MIKYFCDICDKEMEKEMIKRPFNTLVLNGLITQQFTHVCDDCIKEIDKCIKQRGKVLPNYHPFD